MSQWFRSLTAGCWLLVSASAALAQQPFITVASTTSTEESGLFGYLLLSSARLKALTRINVAGRAGRHPDPNPTDGVRPLLFVVLAS